MSDTESGSDSGGEGEWARHDDDEVRPKTQAEVCGLNGQRQAYILVYLLDEGDDMTAAGARARGAGAAKLGGGRARA